MRPQELKDVLHVRASCTQEAILLARQDKLTIDTATYQAIAFDVCLVKRSLWQWTWDTLAGRSPLWLVTIVYQLHPLAEPDPENWDV